MSACSLIWINLPTRLNTAFKRLANFVADGSRPACTNGTLGVPGCSIDDQGVWSAMFRWQRNFLPDRLNGLHAPGWG